MKEAIFFDFLSFFHYATILSFIVFFLGLIFLIRLAFKKRRRILGASGTLLFLFGVFMALIIRASLFPGGSLNDPVYKFEQFNLIGTQKALDEFKEMCGQFPNSLQGLESLVSLPKELKCMKYKPLLKRIPADITYKSDGFTYEIESTRVITGFNFLIKGTDQFKAKIFVRNGE